MNTHQVYKQVVDLALNEGKDFHAVADVIGDLMSGSGLQVVSAALDDISPSSDCWYIEKLEIDLGVISLDELRTEFPARMARQLAASLSSLLQYRTEHKINENILPAEVALWKAWHYYLLNGTPLWSYAGRYTTVAAWERELLVAISATKAKNIIRQLVEEVLAFNSSRERLLAVFSTSFVLEVISILELLSATRQQMLEVFMTLGLITGKAAGLLVRVLKRLLDPAAVTGSSDLLFFSILDDLLQLFPEIEWKTLLAIWYKQVQVDGNEKILPLAMPVILAYLDFAALQQKRDFKEWQLTAGDYLLQTQHPVVIAILYKLLRGDENFTIAFNNIINTPTQSEHPVPEELLKQEDALFIQNAGLVLVAAYLPLLFEQLGYVKDGEFTSNLMQQKAVLLTAYIANGEQRNPDWELCLPKILCGLPLEAVVSAAVIMEKEALEEADNMLQAVIGHWTVLGDTSIAGLREGFLQREGKLVKKDNWHLRVQTSAIDVLLETIPWSFGMIGHSWMDGLLITEWAGAM